MKAREIKKRMIMQYQNAVKKYESSKDNLEIQEENIKQMEHNLSTYFNVSVKYEFGRTEDVPF